MKRYEGLFILNTVAIEDGINETVDRVAAELGAAGCKVEATQKMERKAFTRVADKKFTSGFYVNFVFEAEPQVANSLQKRFALNDEVFRLMVSNARQDTTVAA